MSLFGPVLSRGPRDGRAIYLTFDDGPGAATPRILETLAAAGAPAVFFQIGGYARRRPDLARAVAEAGHEIGNHTQHHRKLLLRGPAFIAREMGDAHEAIRAATGRAPRLFRAPHGLRNPFVHAAADRLGYRVIGWTAGVWDTARPGSEEIRRRVRARLAPGAIILLHDGDGHDPDGDRTQTAEALPGILADARDAGCEVRPLGELLELGGRTGA